MNGMKRMASLLLMLSLLGTLFLPGFAVAESQPDFKGLNDPSLLPYIEDTLYAQLVGTLNSEDYFVENVSAVYISQEYLEELAYNSQANVFFGFTLDELEAQFQGEKYIFTLGDDGKTAVEPWTDYVDPYERVIGNVAVGTGVILVCVTVSAVTGGAPACSMIFAVAAKTGALGAVSGGVLGGVSAGIVTGIQTGDMDAALQAAVVAGSDGFKWGAITGAISGGAGEAVALKGATLKGAPMKHLTMNQGARMQSESHYPLDVIKGFTRMEQYDICRNAGLSPQMVNGKTALVRSVDPDFVDELGRTNLQRMQQGLAALDPTTGQAYQLHHIGQNPNSTLAILTEAEHMQGGNNLIWHELEGASRIDRVAFKTQRESFWKSFAEICLSGGMSL